MAKPGKVEVEDTFVADSDSGEVGVFGNSSTQANQARNQSLADRVASLESNLNGYGFLTLSGSIDTDFLLWGQIGGTLGDQSDLQSALNDASNTRIRANGGTIAAYNTINFAGPGVSRSGNTINIEGAGAGFGDGCRVRKTNTQSIGPGGNADVTFQEVDFDDNGMGSTGVGPLTVPSGVSRVIVTAGFFGFKEGGGGDRTYTIGIEKNGSGFYNGQASFRQIMDRGGSIRATLTTGVVDVSPGDVFSLNMDTFIGGLQIHTGTWMNMVVMK